MEIMIIGTLSSQDEFVDDDERKRVSLGRKRRPKRQIQMFKQAPASARRRSRQTALNGFVYRIRELLFFSVENNTIDEEEFSLLSEG